MNTLKIDNDILINTCSNFENFRSIVKHWRQGYTRIKICTYSKDINFIQFHFCLQGKISLNYNVLIRNNGNNRLWMVSHNEKVIFFEENKRLVEFNYFI